MQFNNYLNWGRFSRLFKQDLLINKTKYVLIIIGLAFVTYALSYWFLNMNKDRMIQDTEYVNQRYAMCFIFYIIAVWLFVGTAFPDLSNQIKTSNYLLAPGSTFEKVMIQFLIRIGFFIPIALGLFWIVVRLAKFSLTPGDSGLDPSSIPNFQYRFLVSVNGTDKIFDIWLILFIIFGVFSYSCFLFAGSTYFRRYALLKTVIVSGILWGISVLTMVLFSHIFYPMETDGFDIHLKHFVIVERLNSFQLAFLMLAALSWIFFLSIAYFKLKEKEV